MRLFSVGLVIVFLIRFLSSNQTCGNTTTLIHDIQGTQDQSPMNRTQDIVIEGVVVGDFQNELDGFFVQEAIADDNPLTSEGIFVLDEGFGVDVKVGDVVRVQGDAREIEHLTAIRNIDEIIVCSSGGNITPTVLELPLEDYDALEAYEGMLVTFPQNLAVTEVFNLGRFGEVVLSANGRLMQPTNVVLPGQEANSLQESNNLNQIILDDNSHQQNPESVPFLIDSTLRLGDTVSNLTGIVSYAFDSFRLQPTSAPAFVRSNPRLNEPENIGGKLRVASFNVLNYFNGDGQDGGFPTSRGASNPQEFSRQHDKIIAALTALNADVIGLMEIENDGYGAESAIQDLINGLNENSDFTYAFINPEFEQGTDEIKVALIYRTETVSPYGEAATNYDSVFDRPPLAQTFEEIATGELFTVVVNHFKSKNCEGGRDENRDAGDGQSCWNGKRVDAARALIDWLETDPTVSGDSDVLIMGDLNSYAMEDPILLLTDAGYTNLVTEFLPEEMAYTYVFFGQAGALDHALASPGLAEQVAGVTIWHINADEPHILDYNEEFKSPEQVTSLYTPDPFRASDHDPVIVGLDLGSE